MFFLNERSEFSEENVDFLKIAFGTQTSFSSQNSLSKKIECLDVFAWNLGLEARIAFENVSKQALYVPSYLPQRKGIEPIVI